MDGRLSPISVENSGTRPRVNDFSIVVASVNGTGSQTANLTLLRALFKMGIPVGGKNIFPSNIQGLPTWYHIRVNGKGYTAFQTNPSVLVAFNESTAVDDIAKLSIGSICIYPKEWHHVEQRDDITSYAIPVSQLLREAGVKGKIRDYMTNMVYVGSLSYLLDIEMDQIREALIYHFGNRPELAESNMALVQLAYDWSAENLIKSDPYRVESLDLTQDQILITGNEAAALGAAVGGVTLASWYPITPSTSLIDALNDFLPRLRQDPETGLPTYVVIQAEDELAAAGMIMGAGFAGARAMTATSGPGISLMSEFVSLGYFAEIPSVIWDIQRVGPSTGLPTRTSQGDVLFAYSLGHGDTKNVLLFPGSVAECFEFGRTAFDLAEELQTPILVLSDLDLGMNTWMTSQFNYPREPLKRGKVLTAEQVEERGFYRYLDIDGDGVTYRTLPGNTHPKSAYFNRGTGHNRYAVYSEKAEDWEDNMTRLLTKFETARRLVPKPVVDELPGADIGILAYGSTLPAIEEARDILAQRGIATSFLRLRAIPINNTVREFVAKHEVIDIVELNRDGQLCQILTNEMPALATRLVSIARTNGLPLDADWLVNRISEQVKRIARRTMPIKESI